MPGAFDGVLNNSQSANQPGPLYRVARILAIAVFIGGSLLTFPSAVPWMVAVWLICHSILVVRGRCGWNPLVACAIILLLKRPPLLSGWYTLCLAVVVSLTIAVLATRRSPPVSNRMIAGLRLALIWIAWFAFVWDWHSAAHCDRPVADESDRPIVCLGDSLTADMPPAISYPTHLQALVSPKVVNLGQAGTTARRALQRLPEVLALHPQAVIVELGGNDFVGGRTRQEVHDDLEQIITAARSVGAEVILVEIPRGFVADPYAGLERELARRHDLELVADTPIRMLVLRSPLAPPGSWLGPPYLSDDGLHPNSDGSKLLAGRVADAITRRHGPTILRSGE